jgi:hypothetical protein
MDQATLLGILRAVLTSAGGALVANGVFTSAQWSDVVGAVLIIGGAAWSYIQKRQAHAALVTAAATNIPAPATIASTLTSPHA